MPLNKVFLPLILGFVLSIITVGGDLLVKEASLHDGFKGWPWLLGGGLVYGLTAVGWFYLMRKEDLSIIGVIYSLTVAVSLFVLGVFLYKEKVTPIELVGMGMAITSLVILYRFG